MVVILDDLGFDWDQANTQHIAGHDVSPGEVEQVFLNEEIDVDYDVVGGEERWTVVGETNARRVLIVIYTMRDARVRPVTAYEASLRMQAHYFRRKEG